MVTKKAALLQIYQIKITLDEMRPPIWRRVQVPGDISLGRLHDVVQIAMGWTNSHMHRFYISEEEYGVPYPDALADDPPMRDERRVRLNQVVDSKKQRFGYTYDFGDNWEHTLLVEDILPPDPALRYPVCIGGKRHGPPEDCGGVYGYDNFLKTIRDPTHKDHEFLLEWAGGRFDPEAFSREQVNQALQTVRGRKT